MVNSCLHLLNTSFILLLSLDISVAFLLYVCFGFSPSLNEFCFCKSKEQFWNLYFILFYFTLFCFVLLSNFISFETFYSLHRKHICTPN